MSLQDKAYEVIDMIDGSNLKKRLEKLKKEIKANALALGLIKKFEDAKKAYEKYGLENDFIYAKKELLKNSLLKEFVELQSKVNLLSMHINSRIKRITEGITDKK